MSPYGTLGEMVTVFRDKQLRKSVEKCLTVASAPDSVAGEAGTDIDADVRPAEGATEITAATARASGANIRGREGDRLVNLVGAIKDGWTNSQQGIYLAATFQKGPFCQCAIKMSSRTIAILLSIRKRVAPQ